MNKKIIRITIITIIAILLLLAVIYFLFMYKFPGSTLPSFTGKSETKQTSQNLPVGNNNTVSSSSLPAKTNNPPATSEEKTKKYLKSMAESFAERLGSYSNQSNFDNIGNLKVLMTSSMRSWADKYVAEQRKNPYSGVYQGVTTQAITSNIKDFDSAGGKADIVVQTQRVTTVGTSNPTTATQDITITLVEQNGNWLVDNATWAK
jgi:hypothetical protein